MRTPRLSALVARGTGVSGPHGTKTIREPRPLRHGTAQSGTHTRSSYEKYPPTRRELQPEGQASGLLHICGLKRDPFLVFVLPWLCQCSLVLPSEELVDHQKPWFLQLSPEIYLQIGCSRCQQSLQLKSQRMMYIFILLKLLPEDLTSNQPETRC